MRNMSVDLILRKRHGRNNRDKICDSCRIKSNAQIEEESEISIEDSKEIIFNLKILLNDQNLTKMEKILLLKLLPKN